MDETLKATYLADLAILSGLAYKSETIMTISIQPTGTELLLHLQPTRG